MSEAFLVLLPLPQHQRGEARPCGPSGRPLAGSIPTRPAGPLLFLPFAATLLPPLGRRRCNAARLFIPSKAPWMSRYPGLRSGGLYKNVQRRQKGLSSGAGVELRPCVGIALSRRDPGGNLASPIWFPGPDILHRGSKRPRHVGQRMSMSPQAGILLARVGVFGCCRFAVRHP